MMQENLQKAFMRGVCALNFEAMNILNPNDVGAVESELERKVATAVNSLSANQMVSSPDQSIHIGNTNMISGR